MVATPPRRAGASPRATERTCARAADSGEVAPPDAVQRESWFWRRHPDAVSVAGLPGPSPTTLPGKTKMKLTSLLMLSLTAGALLAGCGKNETAPAAQSAAAPAAAKIVIGLDDNFPPMGFRNEKNELVGFDIDLAKEAGKRLGLEVKFKAIDWSAKEAELSGKRVDVLWNGLTITEQRKPASCLPSLISRTARSSWSPRSPRSRTRPVSPARCSAFRTAAAPSRR